MKDRFSPAGCSFLRHPVSARNLVRLVRLHEEHHDLSATARPSLAHIAEGLSRAAFLRSAAHGAAQEIGAVGLWLVAGTSGRGHCEMELGRATSCTRSERRHQAAIQSPAKTSRWSGTCTNAIDHFSACRQQGGQAMDDDTRLMDAATKLMPSLPTGEGTEQQDSRLHVVLVHDRASVEALLDWLEQSGRTDRDVQVLVDEFLVRWRE